MILFEDEGAEKTLITLDGLGTTPAEIKVIGIGGAGGNALNRMIEAGVRGVEFVAINTDIRALRHCKAPRRLQIGESLTGGLGTGGDPEAGKKALLESTEVVLELLEGTDAVFLVAGLGGGTGSGATPLIASLAAEVGALVVAVVTKPFAFEGRRRMEIAEQGLNELHGAVDTLITIPNEQLLNFVERGRPLSEAFRISDDVLRQAVLGITDLITVPGEVNVDFSDFKALLTGMGTGLVGIGAATGEGRSMKAAQRSISSPLLEETSIAGAKGVLVNISGGPDLTLHEVAEAAQAISEAVHPNANILSGMVVDENLQDTIRVTVLATGFGKDKRFPFTPLTREKPREVQGPAMVIVWNPEVVEAEEYAALVTALGDLTRVEGGLGIERIKHKSFGTPTQRNSRHDSR